MGVGGCCEGWWSMEVRKAGCQSCSPACRKVKLAWRHARSLAASPSSCVQMHGIGASGYRAFQDRGVMPLLQLECCKCLY